MPLADPVPFPVMRSSVAVSTGNHIFKYGGVGYQATQSILDVSGKLCRLDLMNLSWELLSACRPDDPIFW